MKSASIATIAGGIINFTKQIEFLSKEVAKLYSQGEDPFGPEITWRLDAIDEKFAIRRMHSDLLRNECEAMRSNGLDDATWKQFAACYTKASEDVVSAKELEAMGI